MFQTPSSLYCVPVIRSVHRGSMLRACAGTWLAGQTKYVINPRQLRGSVKIVTLFVFTQLEATELCILFSYIFVTKYLGIETFAMEH